MKRCKSSSNRKLPRAVKCLDDTLGKNKVQQSIYKYFSPSPNKSEFKLTCVREKCNSVCKNLFPDSTESVPSSCTSNAIKDTCPKHLNDYYRLTKTCSTGESTKRAANGLSRKSLKIKMLGSSSLPGPDKTDSYKNKSNYEGFSSRATTLEFGKGVSKTLRTTILHSDQAKSTYIQRKQNGAFQELTSEKCMANYQVTDLPLLNQHVNESSVFQKSCPKIVNNTNQLILSPKSTVQDCRSTNVNSNYLKSTPPMVKPNSKSTDEKNNPHLFNELLIDHCIQECKKYAVFAVKLNVANEEVTTDYLSLYFPEKKLLHRLLMRKRSWIRATDMKYDHLLIDKFHSLCELCDRRFLEDITNKEELQVLLSMLKLPELVELCSKQNIEKKGSKQVLENRLLKFANVQNGLSFAKKTPKMVIADVAFNLIGKCVRLVEGPCAALQSIFEASMSPLYLEGNYSFQERLRAMETLFNDVKFNGKKLVPFSLNNFQLFNTTAQYDEYISSVITKFNILEAKEAKNNVKGILLAKDVLASFKRFMDPHNITFLEKTPNYMKRYTAGFNYASALETSLEFFKRDKQYDEAVATLYALLAQQVFRKHCRGHWYAELVMIMDKYLKKSINEIYSTVMSGLLEDLTPIGRLELSKKAEGLVNKKGSRLDPCQKENIRQILRTPQLTHYVKDIKATEAANFSNNTRQTYIEISATGEKQYLNVEETARNSYLYEYPEGLHDEGSLIKNIILAVFWPIIYMPVDNMFVSRFQNGPLDWGTSSFYDIRKKEFEDHVSKMKIGGIDFVMTQINDVIINHSDEHSVINWYYIAYDMLPTIRNIISCLSLEKFFILAEYLLQSHRERRSGWPDLTLWNNISKKIKLVEVKSTNDELSLKQIVWLEKFMEIGIEVEECRVNARNRGKQQK